jgi:hypothetical protein
MKVYTNKKHFEKLINQLKKLKQITKNETFSNTSKYKKNKKIENIT